MIEVSESDLDYQLDVNLLGVYRVTKAFAPLIIESGGRISTTSSIAGYGQYAFAGPYAISKHAVESMNDSLSLELARLDVHVSTVAPGNYNSNLESSTKAMLSCSFNAGMTTSTTKPSRSGSRPSGHQTPPRPVLLRRGAPTIS